MRNIEKIIVHCSDSDWGSRNEINEWHAEKGWKSPSGISVGYHYVINNCYPDYWRLKERKPDPETDGLIEEGRPEEEIGSHAYGHNSISIGICLIGKTQFTATQLYSLKDLVKDIMERYSLSIEDVYGHRDFSEKECPNLDTEWLRDFIDVG